jgi:GATA-binding protein, other eukaryote
LSLPAAHPDTAAAAAAVDAARRASAPQQLPSAAPKRSQSPLSRAGTPLLGGTSNIAPQSMFDSVTLDNQAFHPSSLHQLGPSAPSPSGSENEKAILALREQLTGLHTRVNELEVINELFRGRVGELEPALENSRLVEKKTRAELELANDREAALKRRIEVLETDLADVRGEQRSKRARLSDIVVEDGSQASTPQSCVS